MKVALIGLGEVGRILAEDLAGKAALAAWDVDLARADSIASANARALGLAPAASAAAAVADADVVISAVTAEHDVAAATEAATGIRAGAFYLDLNSASPGSKQSSAAAIDGAGGRYVEGAVMAPVPPKRIACPILLGGRHAQAFVPVAQALGFSGARFYDAALGKASATKMCRSVMIKGVETLLTESMLTARAWGIEQEVLASLNDLLPVGDWDAVARYMISRSLEHGRRRAEEMREVARTVEEAGVPSLMSAACARRQDMTADLALGEGADLGQTLDAMRARMSASGIRGVRD